MPKLTNKSYLSRTDGRTDRPYLQKSFAFKKRCLGGNGVQAFSNGEGANTQIQNTRLRNINNKDDNIHKSEALKWKGKQTLTLVDCQN